MMNKVRYECLECDRVTEYGKNVEEADSLECSYVELLYATGVEL
jgi:hypothetical protein